MKSEIGGMSKPVVAKDPLFIHSYFHSTKEPLEPMALKYTLTLSLASSSHALTSSALREAYSVYLVPFFAICEPMFSSLGKPAIRDRNFKNVLGYFTNSSVASESVMAGSTISFACSTVQ